ncbi:MAG: ABC transporter ATP-binding protein/permease [Lachnospiraceae bacterium]|nr:ABC transporter ATP-binding protein/permease [Lachnospiraceae bacterium]
MKQILKNMIPYWKSLILIILLLIVQAGCDLALPTYTSDIIDVGIQNSGVEHILPEKITDEEYQEAQIFMTEDERSLMDGLYDAEGEFYILQETDEEVLEEADETLLTPIVLTYQLGHMEESQLKETVAGTLAENEAMAAYAAQVKEMSLEEIEGLIQMDIVSFEAEDENGEVFTYVDMRPIMQAMIESGQMDANMLEDARKQMDETISTVGSDTLKSMGIRYAVSCDEASGVDVEKVQMSYLWSTGGKMALFAVLMMVSAVFVTLLASRVGASIGRDLRQKVFGKVIGFSNAELEKFSTASLITRATNDVQQIQMVSTMTLRMVLYAPIIGIGGIFCVYRTGVGMGWIIALAVLVLVSFVMVLVSVAMPKFKIMQKMVDGLNLVSREILTGLPVIRAFGREKTEEQRFDKANMDLKKTQLFTNRVMNFMMPGMMMIMNCIVVLITWVSAKHIDAGTLQVGAMTAFITYTMQIVISFLMMTAMSIMLPRAGVAADRIQEVIDTEFTVRDKENAVSMTGCKGVVKFDHVSFRYPGADEDVLHDISFTAEPGKVTAIIGSTGAGKSTLVNLIPRFYDVTEGSITLDGVDLRDMKKRDLRAQIGLVPQKGILFSGTIASNLRFGREEATDEEIRQAAEIAQASDFIEEKRKKYDSHIAQGGTNVSGGQKQRLAIARAIAKNPKVFLFDDSFSALDMKTDAALREALAERVADSTEIIVAQRISTILHADQIVVLDEGRVAGLGTHEELLKSCDVYRQIAMSQLSASELGLENEEV